MLVFHIGLPKTGTTTLQYKVFKPVLKERMIHRSIESAFNVCKPMEAYIHEGSGKFTEVASELRNAVEKLGNVLVSNETLCMRPKLFWQRRGITPSGLAEIIGRLAADISNLCEVKVLLGVRRQDLWLASWYAYCGRWHTDFSQADFDRRLDNGEMAPIKGKPSEWLDYPATLAAFGNVLGGENVMPLPIEALEDRDDTYGEELSRFIGTDFRKMLETIKRGGESSISNRTAISASEWLMRGDGERPLRMTLEMSEAILAPLKQSNAQLLDQHGIDYLPGPTGF